MVPWVKALFLILSSIPGVHMLEGENNLLKVAHMHGLMNTQINTKRNQYIKCTQIDKYVNKSINIKIQFNMKHVCFSIKGSQNNRISADVGVDRCILASSFFCGECFLVYDVQHLEFPTGIKFCLPAAWEQVLCSHFLLYNPLLNYFLSIS